MKCKTQKQYQRSRSEIDNSLADLTVSDLSEIKGFSEHDKDIFRARQIAALRRNSPFVLIGNILACYLIIATSWGTEVFPMIAIWAVVLSGFSGFMLHRWLKSRDVVRETCSERAIKKVNKFAFISAAIWALLPAITVSSSEGQLLVFFTACTMASIGTGAFSLSRVPSAAILHIWMVTTSYGISSLMAGGRIGFASVVLGLFYSVSLSAMILSRHRTAMLRANDQRAMQKQSEIITLLLKDFESGSSDWLWETGRTGELIYVPDRLAELLGRDRDRLCGASLYQTAGTPDPMMGWHEVNSHFANARGFSDVEVPAIINGEEHWWRLTARSLHDANGKCIGFRGVCSDVTARHNADIELVKAKKRAEESSDAKSKFLAIMGHELRSPLNAIVGFSDMIANEREGAINHSNYREYAETINDSARHLMSLINDILDMTRIEKGKMQLVEQEIDPLELCRFVAKMIRVDGDNSGVVIVENYSEKPVMITGDLTRLKQILLNLLGNAVKFSKAGDQITLSLSYSKKGSAVFEVIDQGPGLTAEQIELVFQPFVQGEQNSSRSYEGLGLGLAIAYRLARMHDGVLTIDSVPGEGARACLILPPERVSKLVRAA